MVKQRVSTMFCTTGAEFQFWAKSAILPQNANSPFLFSVFCFLFSVFCFLFSVFCFLFSVFCFLFSVFCLYESNLLLSDGALIS